MPNPYDVSLRERAVAAYEDGRGSYTDVAALFRVGQRTLVRWVAQARTTGAVGPLPKRGGWTSPVDLVVLHAVVHERPDATSEELRRAYNRRVPRRHRTSRSGLFRALGRAGYVFKKNGRGPQKPTGRTSAPSGKRTSSG